MRGCSCWRGALLLSLSLSLSRSLARLLALSLSLSFSRSLSLSLALSLSLSLINVSLLQGLSFLALSGALSLSRTNVSPTGVEHTALDAASAYFRSGADKVSIGSDAVYAAGTSHMHFLSWWLSSRSEKPPPIPMSPYT